MEDLQLCYFISYTMYNYISLPFSLSYTELLHAEADPGGLHTESYESWLPLFMTHPSPHLPIWAAHQQVQKSYFWVEGKLLKRMDYTADAMGGVASYYVSDYRDFGGC